MKSKAGIFKLIGYTVVVVIIFSVIAGCGHIQIAPENEPIIARLGARLSGKAIGDNWPSVIPFFLGKEGKISWIDKVTNIEIGQETDFNSLMQAAIQQIKDDFYRQNITDIFTLFKFDIELPTGPGWLTPERIEIIKGAMQGFKEGLEAAKHRGQVLGSLLSDYDPEQVQIEFLIGRTIAVGGI